jgi:hypothetical protein
MNIFLWTVKNEVWPASDIPEKLKSLCVNYVIYLSNCVTASGGLTYTFILLNIYTNLKHKK